MRKIGKKSANFDIYNWFLLFLFVGLMLIAFISLFYKTEAVKASPPLGSRANYIYDALSIKEMNLKIIDFHVKLAANKALREVSNTFGVDPDEVLPGIEFYNNAPLIYTSASSTPLNFINPEQYFMKSFKKHLETELNRFEQSSVHFEYSLSPFPKGMGLFNYDPRSLSILEGDTIYGFSLIDHFIKVEDLVTSYTPDFKYRFENYNLNDYKKIDFVIRKYIYPLFQEEKCNFDRMNQLFKIHNEFLNREPETQYVGFSNFENLKDYELSFNEECKKIHDASDIQFSYRMDQVKLPFAELANQLGMLNDYTFKFEMPSDGMCKVLLCIRDRSRVTSGMTDKSYVVNYPSYKVAMKVAYQSQDNPALSSGENKDNTNELPQNTFFQTDDSGNLIVS
jgi:hypothetical protein